MTATTEQLSAAGLSATSTSDSDPSKLWHGDYDLLVCVSGWDERSVAIVAATDLRARRALLVLFDEMDHLGLRERHDAMLRDFTLLAAKDVTILTGQATAVHELWAKLLTHLQLTYLERGGPLDVLITASTCPRYHTLALLGVGVGVGLIRKLTITYSDGIYPDPSDDEVEVPFTGGTAAVVAVPGLEGSTEPDKKRFFLVSIGFEAWRSMRAITRAEPDRVCVLVPDPGSSPDYVQRCLDDNKLLLTEFLITEDRMIRSHASDAVAAWKALSDRGLEKPDEENVYYLCTGTKPHSIALALRAMQLGAPAVLYSIPEEFRVVQIKAGPKHWRVDIVATTTPSSG